VNDEVRARAIMEAFGRSDGEMGPKWAKEDAEKRKPC